MMIFDSFPSREKAEEFAGWVRIRFKRKTKVCTSQDESDKVDPFPCELTPPIVLVTRVWKYGTHLYEEDVVASVQRFGGSFAGT